MEGYPGEPLPALISHFRSPGWNSIQALNTFQQELGGSLRGGDPGCRLIEPALDPTATPVAQVPPAWVRRTGKLLVVPFHHIFGSEELSVVSPSVASLTPAPSIAVNPEDVRELDLHLEQEIQISLGGVVYHVALRLDPSLPAGVAGLTVGLPCEPLGHVARVVHAATVGPVEWGRRGRPVSEVRRSLVIIVASWSSRSRRRLSGWSDVCSPSGRTATDPTGLGLSDCCKSPPT
jgi:hypothetical protein